MPPKLDPNGDSELIAVRLTPELTAALDAEVTRQRAENPDVYIGRSNVLRALVRKVLLATAPPRPAVAPSAAVVEAPVEARPASPAAAIVGLDPNTVRGRLAAAQGRGVTLAEVARRSRLHRAALSRFLASDGTLRGYGLARVEAALTELGVP